MNTYVLTKRQIGGREANRQQQAGKPFIKIREVIWGDPHPVQGLWMPYISDTIYEKYSAGNWDIDRLCDCSVKTLDYERKGRL